MTSEERFDVEEETSLEPSDADIIDSMITVRMARKAPNIDNLQDAIVDGVFLLKKGENIVIERWFTSGERRYWMGTNTYTINAVHENGDLALTDVGNLQAAAANWITGPQRGWRFKSTARATTRREVKRRRRGK